MEIKKTNQIVQDGIKILVYGQSGAGKTTLIATLPEPVLIISNEAGLLPLKDKSLDVLEVHSFEELKEAYFYVMQHKDEYKSIALDSVSELAEVVLANEKEHTKDQRQAYMAMADSVVALIRKFRDLSGVNVYFSAKMEKMQDDTGKILFAPSMPGQKVANQLPYFFDEVFMLHVLKNDEGKLYRVLQTQGDDRYVAKDRSGVLDMAEQPNLSQIIGKIIK